MRALLLLLVLLATAPTGSAEVIRVGIHDKPPFATKNSAGNWEGLAVDLWTGIAARTGLSTEFVELPFAEILPAIAAGRVDVGAGEIDVTADRARLVEFTQPYLTSEIGVVVRADSWHPDWAALARDFLNWTLVQVVLGIVAGMLLVSLLIWWLERHHHVGHFRGGLTGFGSALWFTAVTMTTVGYGDKTPSTLTGRIVSFFWMIVGVLLIGAFTAAVASSVAAAKVNESVTRASDLRRLVCGVLEGSDSSNVLREDGISSRPFSTIEEALAALAERRIDAVVADRTSLAWLLGKPGEEQRPVRLRLAPLTLRQTFLAVPLRRDLASRAAINVALLEVISSPAWRVTLQRWLGANAPN